MVHVPAVSRILGALLRLANSPRRLALSGVSLLTICGMLYDHFEGKGFFDSLWWAVVTASTVGYGDFYPKTHIGKVVGMVLITSMVLFVLPLITANFTSQLIVNRDAFTHEEQEDLKRLLAEVHNAIMTKDEPCPTCQKSAPGGPSTDLSLTPPVALMRRIFVTRNATKTK